MICGHLIDNIYRVKIQRIFFRNVLLEKKVNVFTLSFKKYLNYTGGVVSLLCCVWLYRHMHTENFLLVISASQVDGRGLFNYTQEKYFVLNHVETLFFFSCFI